MVIEEVAAFDWNLLITALTGLGGVAVGGFVTWKIQDRQLKHVDENRFQEERMGVYGSFMHSANILTTKYKMGFTLPADIDDYAEELMNSYKKIHLIASVEILDKAKYLYSAVADIQRNPSLLLDEKTKKLYSQTVDEFVIAVRKELKIDINI